MFIGCFNRSVVLTYIGVACAAAGISFAAAGKIKAAMLCLIFSGVADLFDGMVARKFKRTEQQKAFGVQIDSLADMVNFAVLPSALMLALGFNRTASLAAVVLYIIAAITRLAHFNTGATPETQNGFYSGLPVTFSALIFPLCHLLCSLLPGKIYSYVYFGVFLLTALLFVLGFKLKKPRGKAYIFLGLLAVALTVCTAVYG